MDSIEGSLRDFHKKYGHLINNSPQVPTQPIKDLRLSLCLEEFTEFFEALLKNDMTEIADGAADLVYVVVGTCISYGISFDRVFQEVHRSNMTKTAVKAEDGQKYGTKTPKGPDYQPPMIDSILRFPEVRTDLETVAFEKYLQGE